MTKRARPLLDGLGVCINVAADFSGDSLLVVSELKQKKRTILAVVAASVISLVVWGLVVALNVR